VTEGFEAGVAISAAFFKVGAGAAALDFAAPKFLHHRMMEEERFQPFLKYVTNKLEAKMGKTHKQFSREFKAKVALEAIRGLKTSAELSSEYGVHVTQIGKWKNELREGIPKLFSGKADRVEKDKDQLIDQLYKQIGKLQMENDWLKKKLVI
jgi:transposase-like protein